MKVLHPGKTILSKIPTPALPAHTHTAGVLGLPITCPYSHCLYLEAQNVTSSLSNPKRIRWKGVIHMREKISTMQGIEICRESFSVSPIPHGTSTFNLHHRLLQNIVFLVLKKQLSERQGVIESQDTSLSFKGRRRHLLGAERRTGCKINTRREEIIEPSRNSRTVWVGRDLKGRPVPPQSLFRAGCLSPVPDCRWIWK